MCADSDMAVDNVVDLYRLRICAALDGMSDADIRGLVDEIERKIADGLSEEPGG